SMPGPAPSRRSLLLCLHNHQPAGNFDSVIEGAARDAYLPFLGTLADFPSVKVTVHFSGFLLRWLAERSPETFSLLKLLSDRGQAELLGGGMYEPILALLPERDRLGQIEALAAEVKRFFGKEPGGIWLAERVWEPDLPVTLAAAGVKYLPVDDYHFVRAGLSPRELDGVYLTEYNGASVRVFPGSERLRYLIPFGDVGETLREIERLTSRAVPYPAAIFADDGEKFGSWPGTNRSVYGEGWLRRFFGGIAERADWLTTMTFGEYVSVAPPRGTVYLPTCSYAEMGEWALPPGGAARFGDLLHALRSGEMAEMKPFLQGGYFRNFLRKYAESNQLHKRMLWVSGRVAAARRVRPVPGRAACEFLYKAQSNDVYWHGVFGGLYLNHLREAAYANLLRAEAASDAVLHGGKMRWTEAVRGDIDRDGGEELLLKTSGLTLLAHAHDGGAVTEISLPRRAVALGHVLTRREEGYHEKFRRAVGSFDGSTSIHDAMVLKDPSVLSALGVDPWQRASFREAYYGDGVLPEAISEGAAAPRCVTAGREATVTVLRRGSRLAAEFAVPLGGNGVDLHLVKALALRGGGERFEARFRLENRGAETASGWFCSEWNLNMLSGNGPDRYYEGMGEARALSSSGVAKGVRGFRVVDAWRNVAAEAALDRECVVLREPVETASLSESGAEKIHQGVCLRVLFPVRMEPGTKEHYSILWTF
ncbi:MAG TPA: alpha-amylase/4-alpha-glucanotransferase domain-containing protein, partial [Candidatus Deferrimicrobium sp.]